MNKIFGKVCIPKIYRDTEGKTYESIYDFPNRGRVNVLYVDTSDNALYRWDETHGKYYCVGRDYKNIDGITGGQA